MASFTFIEHHRSGEDPNHSPKFFGKGHYKLLNNTDVDINYSPNGSDWFTLHKKYNSVYNEIVLFDCSKLVVDTSTDVSATGEFIVQELPVNNFTSISFEKRNDIY